MEQLDLFGTAARINTPARPAAPIDVQLSLFRPDFRAIRTPKRRGKAAAPVAPVALDPALHTDTLI